MLEGHMMRYSSPFEAVTLQGLPLAYIIICLLSGARCALPTHTSIVYVL